MAYSQADTESDKKPHATIVALLQSEGIALTDEKPHYLTETELVAAGWIVLMGWDLYRLNLVDTAVPSGMTYRRIKIC